MKLLVCDVEGTIFKAKYKIDGTDYASTMWQPLARVLGENAIAEERKTHEKWENKEYDNYIDWVNATVEIHKKYKLKKKDFYELIDTAEYVDGVKDFFRDLDRTKYVPVLVSGGFQELVRRAQNELGINYGYGACEYFFDDSGSLVSYSLTPCDFEGKFNFVKYLFSVYGLNQLKDWVFIGDGKNDLHISEKSPLSFGINAHPELASKVKYNLQNFNDVGMYLKNEEEILNISSPTVADDLADNADKNYNEMFEELNEFKRSLESIEKAIHEIEEDRNVLDGLLTESSKENEAKDFEIFKLNSIVEQHKKAKSYVDDKITRQNDKIEKEEAKRSKNLLDSWEIHLPKLVFESCAVKAISKLNYTERRKVEKRLKQLHDADNPRTLSRGKLSNGNDHAGVNLVNGFPARIEYFYDNKKINIITFYKHNSKYMQ